jgi:hypothetical protein
MHAGVDPELWFEDVILLAQFVARDYDVKDVSVDGDDDKYLAAAASASLRRVASWIFSLAKATAQLRAPRYTRTMPRRRLQALTYLLHRD